MIFQIIFRFKLFKSNSVKLCVCDFLAPIEVKQEPSKPVGTYRPPGAVGAYRPPGMRQAMAGGGRVNRAPEIHSEIAFPSLQQAIANPKRLVKRIFYCQSLIPLLKLCSFHKHFISFKTFGNSDIMIFLVVKEMPKSLKYFSLFFYVWPLRQCSCQVSGGSHSWGTEQF